MTTVKTCQWMMADTWNECAKPAKYRHNGSSTYYCMLHASILDSMVGDISEIPPICEKCGNNRQVWINQISGKWRCHRISCERDIAHEGPQ